MTKDRPRGLGVTEGRSLGCVAQAEGPPCSQGAAPGQRLPGNTKAETLLPGKLSRGAAEGRHEGLRVTATGRGGTEPAAP